MLIFGSLLVIEYHCKNGTHSLIANGEDNSGIKKYMLTRCHKEDCKCGCTIFKPKKLFFTSPTIRYCENTAYAGHGTSYKNGKIKCVMQVRQKPGSYHILNETVGATARKEVIDKNFSNDEVAYFTAYRYPAIVPCGIMVKYENTEDIRKKE